MVEVVELPKHRPAQVQVEQSIRIPKKIHQTFKATSVPARMFQAAKSWWELNPDFEYYFCDDDDAVQFIRSEFGLEAEQCYLRLPAGPFRADFWRYCWMFEHGGVYADIDMECAAPLSELLHADDEFVVAQSMDARYLYNAFLCAKPKHPFFERTVRRAIQLVNSGSTEMPYMLVGPGGLGVAANEVLQREPGSTFEVGRTHFGDAVVRVVSRTPELHEDSKTGAIYEAGRAFVVCKYDGYLDDLGRVGARHWTSEFDNWRELFPAWGSKIKV